MISENVGGGEYYISLFVSFKLVELVRNKINSFQNDGIRRLLMIIRTGSRSRRGGIWRRLSSSGNRFIRSYSH